MIVLCMRAGILVLLGLAIAILNDAKTHKRRM